LLHRWVKAREYAFAEVLAADHEVPDHLIVRARKHLAQWNVADEQAQTAIERSRLELDNPVAAQQETTRSLWAWGQLQSVHTQELLASLILECGSDEQSEHMHAGSSVYSTEMSARQVAELIQDRYAWALVDDAAEHWFWYVSENKLEPRIGDRAEVMGDELERPLTIVRQVKQMYPMLKASRASLGDWLAQHPEFHAAAMRVLVQGAHPYSEIQDNLLGPAMRPIDMLRFKLAFFGASKFDPKSDLWTRITLFQGAPTRDDLAQPGDDWWLAAL